MRTAWSASRTWRAPRSQSEYTATVAIPSSRHARMTRTAISPRFAIRTFTTPIVIVRTASMGRGRGPELQRNVAVLLRWILVSLRLESRQGRDQLRARLAGVD